MMRTLLLGALIGSLLASVARAQAEAPAQQSAGTGSGSGSGLATGTSTDLSALNAAAAGAAGSASGSGSGSAGDTNPNKDLYDSIDKEIKDQLDAHKLPQTPATFALGLETTEIQRPATMQDVGAALLNSFNGDSSLKTGVAIEFAPFRIWKTSQFTAEQWIKKDLWGGWPVLDSLAISLATTQGPVDATTGMKGPPITAVGARLDLVNTADLRRSAEHYKCVNKVLVAINDAAAGGPHQPQPDNDGAVLLKTPPADDAAKQLQKCNDERKGIIVELAGAVMSAGEPSMGSSKFAGGRLWMSTEIAYKSWDLTVQGDFRDRKEDRARHDLFAGFRADNTLDTQHHVALAVEGYYAGTDLNVDADAKGRLGIGSSVDLKFDSGLVLSLGAQSRTDFSTFDLVVLTKISIMINGQSKDLVNQYFNPVNH